MEVGLCSRSSRSIALKNNPVALICPTLPYRPCTSSQDVGCVASLFGSVAKTAELPFLTGTPMVAGRWCRLGFGNCYEKFPAVFLASVISGRCNSNTETGRQIAKASHNRGERTCDDFLNGDAICLGEARNASYKLFPWLI